MFFSGFEKTESGLKRRDVPFENCSVLNIDVHILSLLNPGLESLYGVFTMYISRFIMRFVVFTPHMLAVGSFLLIFWHLQAIIL